MSSTDELPTYQRIKVALLEEVNLGAYQRDRPFITEREICGRFGVSRTTAVRALSDLVHDGVLTRRRGRGTFVSDSYQPGRGRPAKGAAKSLGCILQGLHTQHPTTILRGIEHMCREANYDLLLFDSQGDPGTEAEDIRRALRAGVAGFIVYPANGFANAALFESLQRGGIPLVLIDRYYPMLPTDVVIPDNIDIGFRLTDYLIGEGHRHIALIWEHETFSTSLQDRLAGYRLALRDHDLPFEPNLAALRPYTTLSPESRRAILSSWFDAPYCPTAYLAVNSHSLVTVATDLLSLNKHLPEDMALASMDNASLDALLALTVATATLPSFEMGTEAMRLILGHLDGTSDRPTRHIVLPAKISTGKSVTVNLRLLAV